MGTEEEIRRPLWQRGRSREVNRRRGFAETISGQPRQLLVDEFHTDQRHAPSRTPRGKSYLDEHRMGFPQCDVPSGRHEENLMMALFNEGSIQLPGGDHVWILDYQTPLCARRSDGAGKIDATGLTPRGSLCLMELKSPRDNKGDSPLRALLECLSYAAAAADSTASTLLLQLFSISSKLGRTCAGIARRPISTAIIGADPFRNDSSRTRSTCR